MFAYLILFDWPWVKLIWVLEKGVVNLEASEDMKRFLILFQAMTRKFVSLKNKMKWVINREAYVYT